MSTAFSIGWSKAEITPAGETPLTGFVRRAGRTTNVIADPLFVRVLVLRGTQTHTALLVYDLLGFNEEIGNALRQAVVEETGLSNTQVILACTHTHSGPPTIELTGCGGIDPDYVTVLIRATRGGVRRALCVDQRVDCMFNQIDLPEVLVNRRDSRLPTNDRLSVLQFNTAAGTVGAIVHYSAHPNVTSEHRISADYPGYVCRLLEQRMGLAFVLFLLGTAGDTNFRMQAFSYDEMERLGGTVGDAATAALHGGQAMEPNRLSVVHRHLKLHLKPHTTRARLEHKIESLRRFKEDHLRAPAKRTQRDPLYDQIAWMLLENDLTGIDPAIVQHTATALLENNQRYLSALSNRVTRWVDLRVQFLVLGELVLVFVGAELFAHIALKFDRDFPRKRVLLCGCLDPLLGYLVPPEEYEHGGYEVDEAFLFYGADLPFPRTAERTLVACVSDHLTALHASGDADPRSAD